MKRFVLAVLVIIWSQNPSVAKMHGGCSATVLNHTCIIGGVGGCGLPFEPGQKVEIVGSDNNGREYSIYKTGSYWAKDFRIDNKTCRVQPD